MVKISVAMCTYNGARYLPEQLASIAVQTRQPDELVVCDDHSDDATQSIIKEFAARVAFPVRLHLNERNLGPARNFAAALGHCAGDIIALCDQDDVWRAEKLARIESEFERAPEAGLFFSDAEVVDDELRPLGYRAWQCQYVEFGVAEQQLVRGGRALEVLLTRNIVTGATMALRSKFRGLIAPLPPRELNILHDYWIALLVSAAAAVVFVEEPLVLYRRHAGQHTGLLPPPTGGHSVFDLSTPLFAPLHARLAMPVSGPSYPRGVSKLEHLATRARMRHEPFLARARSVLKEVLRLRYHRHSGGLRTAARDMSLPHRVAGLRLKGSGERGVDGARRQ